MSKETRSKMMLPTFRSCCTEEAVRRYVLRTFYIVYSPIYALYIHPPRSLTTTHLLFYIFFFSVLLIFVLFLNRLSKIFILLVIIPHILLALGSAAPLPVLTIQVEKQFSCIFYLFILWF